MRIVGKMTTETSSICTLVILLGILTAIINCGSVQMLKCFVCSHSMSTDCDFLEYIEDPGRYLQVCENPIVNNKTVKAKCHVEIATTMGVRSANRFCGPVSCPAGMMCCDCSKKGCNGNNKCNFLSSAIKWYPTNLPIILPCICWLLFCQLEIYL